MEQLGGTKSRTKLADLPILSREEAESVLHLLAVSANEKRLVTAAMDAELLAVKERYQPKLTSHDSFIEAAVARLENYATAHPEIFPKDRKSVEWSAGKFGFRTDTPSLALTKRTFGWAQILVMIVGRRLRKFVRTKLEVDKDAILARCGTLDKPTKFQRRTLPTLGLKIVQGEKFFVEPALTEVRS